MSEPSVTKMVRACSCCSGRGKIPGTKGQSRIPVRMRCVACNGRGFMDVVPPAGTKQSGGL